MSSNSFRINFPPSTMIFALDNIVDEIHLFDLVGKTEYMYANVMEPSRYALEVSV